MKAILRSRLYVPVKDVDPVHFDSFNYSIEDPACARCKEKSNGGCLDCPLSEAKQINTYKRMKGVYAFCRGDLGKIYKVFRKFDIVNETATPKFQYNLKFTTDLWENQKDTVNTWLKYKYGIIESPPRSGKAQPLYSLIKTPGGWTRMGDIKVGDLVSTPDGKSVPVTGIFPQGLRPTYRVTFEDGRTTDCDENHLWKVYNRNWGKEYKFIKKDGSYSNYKPNPWRVLSLKEIINKKSKYPLFIPLLKEVYNDEKDLPLDSYVLGLLLGDGCISSGSITFTSIDKENIYNLKSRLIKGYYLQEDFPDSITYRLTHGKRGITNHYQEALKNLGLWGHRSWEKFIPEIYKEASVKQRLELLQGLMDTDGEAGKCVNHTGNHSGGSISYSTSSHRLALDVQYLVRSLGGLCKISMRKPFYTYKGVRKQGRTSFRCNIRYDFPEIFMKLNRKKERAVKSLDTTLKCKIKSIKYLGMQETQCISIDHPDHLYITNNFVVTHNTIMGCYIACVLGLKTLIVAHQSDLLDQFYTTLLNHTNLKVLRKECNTDKIVGLTNCREDISNYDICLTTYQSFISELGSKQLELIRNSFGLVMVDECFPKDTEVMVDYDKYMTIKEIVENPNITHVLSYDLENKKIVKKKIIAKSISPNIDGWSTMNLADDTFLKSTKNHNIITPEGKINAKDMKGKQCITYKAENLKKVKYCSICNSLYHVLDNMHTRYCRSSAKKCNICGLYFFNILSHVKQSHERTSAEKEKIRRKKSINRIAFNKSTRGKEIIRWLSDTRKGEGNPIYHNKKAAEKIGQSKKDWFASMSSEERQRRISIFINAPRYRKGKNKVEALFEELAPEFTFTGDGKYFVNLHKDESAIPKKCLSCKNKCSLILKDVKRKNPDFIYVPDYCGVCSFFDNCVYTSSKEQKSCPNFKISSNYHVSKVVEIMDFEYWHCKEEISYLKHLYKNAGIKCSIIDAKKVNAENVKAKVESLLRNCTVNIIDVNSISKGKSSIPLKYNLEIEDTHNYFVLAKSKKSNDLEGQKSLNRTPVLVSNCHLSGADCYRRMVDRINSKYRLGLSATPERKDKLQCLVYDILGPITAHGISNEMHCIVENHNTNYRVGKFTHWQTFTRRLCENQKRNKLICDKAVKDVANGRYVLIVTERRAHIDDLVKTLQDSGLRAVAFDGRINKNFRSKFLDQARSGQVDVVVAMRKMIKLGIDVPLWDVYYYIMPIGYDKNYYQEMSRIRTPYPKELKNKLGHDKPTPIIRMFLDYGHGAVYACHKIANKVNEEQGFTIMEADKMVEQKTKKAGW